jgi:FkbM family methyltransferase
VNTGMRRVAWARTAVGRLSWGAREAGLARTLAGLARLGWLAVRQPSKVAMVTANSGLRIAFNYPSQLMPLLMVFQELLDPELAMLPRLLAPGRTAFDVGASIGTWTLCAAQTGATVHACEPDHDNFSLLNENVASNGFLSTVTTHDCALGTGEGWSQIDQGDRRYLTNVRLSSDATVTAGTRVWSLDQFVESVALPHIDVLKVNTAGCEADVIIGCRTLFQQQRIGVAIVLDGLAVRPLLDDLRQFSYQLGFYDGRRRTFVPVGDSSQLDARRPGPMNRYIVLKHAMVTMR